jgi:hypothetical protein
VLVSDVILDHPIIGERYFFPRPTPPPDPFTVESGEQELVCARHIVDPSARTMVHFHGNGEVVADYLPGFVEMIEGVLGWNVFFAEYRGYGGSTGRPGLGALLEDVPAIHEAVGRSPSEIVVFGRSVGSIPAIEYAARYPDIGGLVLESGIADPLERVLLRASPSELGVTREELEAQARHHLDHREKLSGYAGPLLVMHARGDHLVDVTHAERNYSWAGGDRRELVLFDRGDHNSIFAANRRAYLEALRSFGESL